MKIKALRDVPGLQEFVKYAHYTDAGIDLIAAKNITIPQGHWVLVPTGIAVELPANHFGLVLPRSGLSKELGLQILGGVIDNGYRGEIFVNLANYGSMGMIPFFAGDRIAQLAVIPYRNVELEWVNELTQTDRGEAGHGSTGP